MEDCPFGVNDLSMLTPVELVKSKGAGSSTDRLVLQREGVSVAL